MKVDVIQAHAVEKARRLLDRQDVAARVKSRIHTTVDAPAKVFSPTAGRGLCGPLQTGKLRAPP
ncbi:hypothetical protein C5D60_01680 [Rathayibacter toxicus]|uniref:Uncharacterized protein n=1 Tax=Rathayibacter toxicus TaxID=145458 RepID=A0A0C5BDP2_9MICO|nr:hypothetical protein TI83_01845 [Rathayibacter toxicus]ALS57140.1 hypothetical protein APU90_04640 [Rathayibacter toxicus]KKM46050.1 hypothetical protein VT73_02855 [Rathayibacter toxicus]PPG47566.1 hypothetical protein C5D16_01620 [Rathayibacter toxicus]PPH64438.1 hypothetical protein C5D13_01675 [Rathayibacter toxicus]